MSNHTIRGGMTAPCVSATANGFARAILLPSSWSRMARRRRLDAAKGLKGEERMTKRLARVGASPRDLELTQQNYSDRFLKIEEYEQEKLIASPRFEACSTSLEARNEAIELFAMINAAIKLVARDFAGLRFKGISELRDGQLHQYIFANLHVDLEMIHSLTVTGGAASVPPRRSLAERMTELMERDDRVRESANTLLMEPVSFGNLNLVYPVHVMTRKSFGLMTRKLSVTESQRSAQFPGTFSRRKLSVASANWAQVA